MEGKSSGWRRPWGRWTVREDNGEDEWMEKMMRKMVDGKDDKEDERWRKLLFHPTMVDGKQWGRQQTIYIHLPYSDFVSHRAEQDRLNIEQGRLKFQQG